MAPMARSTRASGVGSSGAAETAAGVRNAASRMSLGKLWEERMASPVDTRQEIRTAAFRVSALSPVAGPRGHGPGPSPIRGTAALVAEAFRCRVEVGMANQDDLAADGGRVLDDELAVLEAPRREGKNPVLRVDEDFLDRLRRVSAVGAQDCEKRIRLSAASAVVAFDHQAASEVGPDRRSPRRALPGFSGPKLRLRCPLTHERGQERRVLRGAIGCRGGPRAGRALESPKEDDRDERHWSSIRGPGTGVAMPC